MIDAPSPNHGPRRGVAGPDMIVLHYTAMETAEAALDRLRDPSAEVSAHWLIGEDGRVWRLVGEERRAWHAGVAEWAGESDVNSRSIGVELANDSLGPFPAPQIAALETLLRAATSRWGVPPERVVGHQCVAPMRKADPGPRFDWRGLARSGLAIWIDGRAESGRDEKSGSREAGAIGPSAPGEQAAAARFRAAARAFGYALAADGAWDAEAEAVARAFRARFRPFERAAPAAPPGPAALAQLEALARRWPAARPLG